ncbi:hypothetical protein ABIA33_000150 [Streptacidiphilus sp. MAP12-16]|uniref:DUF1707 SHOCT-like domain-containing protein n=1 Tax=Streptacidiphilus sp. MAP12-16 TaxID=3156300 RepID=UPI003512A9D0
MSQDLVPDGRALRASHEDRDQAVEQLRVAAGDGRLTPDELDERLEIALTARTYGELALLLHDLPAAPGAGYAPARAATPGPATPRLTSSLAPAPKELVRLESRHGNIERIGPWSVPRRLEVEATAGNAVIDFTEAVVSRPTLDLTVAVRSGNLTLIVPPEVAVDMDSVAVRSGNVRQRVRREPGAPIRLQISVSGSVRSGNITVRGPRRGFLDWLFRRRPNPARASHNLLDRAASRPA